jgi:4-aminobutyrate aminotransferase-like enzyme
LHTSTVLGHPLACAAAGAVLSRLEGGLAGQAEALGRRIIQGLVEGLADLIDAGVVDVRGLGLLIGVELRDQGGEPIPAAGVAVAERLLRAGVLALPAGDSGAVIELSPPVVLTDGQVRFGIDAVVRAVRAEFE